jgi:hypothetical protein
MRSTLPWSVGSRSMHTSGLGLAFLLTLLGAAAVSCGRIPGLNDAAIQAPTDNAPPTDDHGGQRGDGSLAIADAALDARRTTDVAVGSGGAAGDLGTGGVGGLGGKAGTSGSATSCSGVVVSAATREPADVLLVLDRSGSMSFSITEECSCDPSSNPHVVCVDTSNCTTRWASLATTLHSTLSSTPYLHWGLKLFSSPNAGPCAVTSGVEVPIGADTTTAIEAQIAGTAFGGETPTALAITTATAYLKTQTDANSKMILLATDGKPNCGGSPPSVYEEDVTGTTDAITAALNAGFLVYVIGIGTGTSVTNLDTLAQAGGTGSYYPAQSAGDLTNALVSISKAATCTFALAAIPPDPNDVAVYLNKNMVPQDASNGWSYGANSQTVLLHGSFCDQALSEPAGVVQALFSCGLPLPPVLP